MTDQTVCQILVVEDEVLVAMHVEDLVIAMGHEVIGPASRVGEALLLAQTSIIDFAILDVNLAGEVSTPVAAILRERGIPFVFATGYGSGGAALGSCTERTLQKPYASQELRQAITEGVTTALNASVERKRDD